MDEAIRLDLTGREATVVLSALLEVKLKCFKESGLVENDCRYCDQLEPVIAKLLGQ